MPFGVTADPSRFDDAVAWFRDRLPITDAMASEIGDYAAPRAWKIAGLLELEAVQAVHESIAQAIESGATLEEWKKQITDELVRDFGSSKSARLDTVFVNANQQAYNAGRWRQMHDPDVKLQRPFGLFDAIDDSSTTQICHAHDGTVMPLDDPRWDGISPQLHHRCRSRIRNIRAEDADARGGTTAQLPSDDDQLPATGFGGVPTYSDWEPDQNDYSPELYSEFEQQRRQLEFELERPNI